MKVYELMNMLSGMEAGQEAKLNFEVKISRLVEIGAKAEDVYTTVEMAPYDCDKENAILFCEER